jgi:ribonuclease HI
MPVPWRHAILRGQRVLARCAEDGALVVEGGRVEVRYKPQDSRAYRAAERNLELVPGAVLADDHCAPAGAEPVQSKTAKAATADLPPAVHDPDTIIAYTDGACSGNPGPCGLGVVLTTPKGRKELSEYLGHGTNNIAELTAIQRALQGVEDPTAAMIVHTDSQYAIGVLKKGWKAKANQELIVAIKACMKPFTRLSFVYVRGHAGIPLNERADELARQAVSAQATTPWREVVQRDVAHL